VTAFTRNFFRGRLNRPPLRHGHTLAGKTVTAFTRNFLFALLLLACLSAGVFAEEPAAEAMEGQPEAAPDAPAGLEVAARVAARGGNYVQARDRAVHEALKQALDESLKEQMGAEAYNASAKQLASLLANPERYVQSYRFLEATDNLEDGTSSVLLSVTLYSEAVKRALGKLGVLSGPGAGERVVVLIRESGLEGEAPPGFWDQEAVSEAALAALLGESGRQVVPRQEIRALFSEEQVVDALKGDVAMAVRIGWKAGADTVILGNAVSTSLGDGEGPARVRSVLSVKAISVSNSAVVAAKSDFAQAEADTPAQAGERALKSASGKISDFLIASLRRAGDRETGGVVKRPGPESLPMPINDL